MAGLDPPSPSQPAPAAPSSLLVASGIILAIAGLYFGRDFFIPFTLAILLAFALSPIINGLRRLRVPRVPAVLITVLIAFTIIGGLSYVVATQLVSLADSLPRYQQTMLEKIREIRGSGPAQGGVVERLSSTIEGVTDELAEEDEAAPPGGLAAGARSGEPIPVTIEPGPGTTLEVLRTVLGPLISPLMTAGIVVVFVIFVLLERESLKDRFIKLVGAGDLQTSTDALSEAGSRVSRYLLMQLVVNISYGVPIGVGLSLIGIPNAVLWGMLAVVLRFIPYLGPVLAALFPIALAFAVDPGWTMLFWVIGLFLFMELVSNNFVEPWLYGASTGLSSVAIISAAIFWTMLWGPVGLMLSTPLTVCLVVLGRYVPQLEFFGTLLGSDPVLEPEEQLYQRLLGGNEEAAIEMAETYVDEYSSTEFYDKVAIPVLRLAENDRQRNRRNGGHRRTVAEGLIAVMHEVADHIGQTDGSEAAAADETAPVAGAAGTPVLSIGGKTDLDLAAAEVLAQALGERSIGMRVLPPISISQSGIGQLDLAGIEVVCLVYLATEPRSYARLACRRLKRRSGDVRLLVCLLNPAPDVRQIGDLGDRIGADAVVFSVENATAQIAAWVAPQITEPMQPAPIPENERDRIAALENLGLTKGENRYFDEVAGKVAAAFGTPIALVTVVDEEHQHWPGAAGLPAKLDACRVGERETSICGHVVASNETVVVEDVARDTRFANNPFLVENGIRFYAGAPLRTSSGHAIGSLCVIDTAPRKFGDQDRKVLRRIADDLMVKVERECRSA